MQIDCITRAFICMFFESPLQILIRQLLCFGAKTGWKLSPMGLAKRLYSHSYVSPLWKYG